MALNEKDLLTLFKITANAKPSTSYEFNGEKFSYKTLNDTLRTELNALAGNYKLYRRNKDLVFELIEQAVDDVLPKKVMQQYSEFANVKVFAQGQKPIFIQKVTAAAKKRAKQFITKVGLAGIYEVFKLDGRSYEVQTNAYGGAAQIGFEEFLDNRVDLADVYDIILEGLDEIVYEEIAKALKAMADSLVTASSANSASVNGFSETEMDRLLAIADSYGTQSTIYCTFEFAATMTPAKEWVSEDMKNQKWNNGYLANYKGHRVIVLAQSYTDTSNTKKKIDPSYCYILPTTGDKPIDIALEGETIVREIENADMSREIQVYKKLGVAAKFTPNMCVYINTQLHV